ncbi:MAG: CCA tRNA nucleotidyltransferase [Nitrososphaerota archaeon]
MTNRGRLDEVLRQALYMVRPAPEELKMAENIAQTLVESLRTAFAGRAVKVTLEGSYAKGTVLRGRNEVDIFIHFHPSNPLDKISRETIETSSHIIKSLGGIVRLRYAEHPYTEGFIDKVRVNIVPCYSVEKGAWITAVDRTPYHTEFVRKNLRENQVGDVQLLKGFLTASDLYGAEIRVSGFSGYLCELLIIHYGTLANLIREAVEWRPPVLVGPKSIALHKKYPSAAMILADPVDENRNVAAAVSAENLHHFVLLSRLFLAQPRLEYFNRPSWGENLNMAGRGLLSIVFDTPSGKPPDILWGEIRRTAEGISRCLAHHGFTPLRWKAHTDERSAVILFELDETVLPPHHVHAGPPVTHHRAIEFVQRQVRSPRVVAGPWISGGRLYSLRRREYTRADRLLMEKLKVGEISVAKGLAEALNQAKITQDSEVIKAELDARDLTAFLAEFVEACPGYIKTYRSHT